MIMVVHASYLPYVLKSGKGNYTTNTTNNSMAKATTMISPKILL